MLPGSNSYTVTASKRELWECCIHRWVYVHNVRRSVSPLKLPRYVFDWGRRTYRITLYCRAARTSHSPINTCQSTKTAYPAPGQLAGKKAALVVRACAGLVTLHACHVRIASSGVRRPDCRTRHASYRMRATSFTLLTGMPCALVTITKR